MIPLLITIIICFLSFGATYQFVTKKIQFFANSKALELGVLAVVSVIASFVTDTTLIKIAHPGISIETTQRDKEIDIRFQIHKSFWGIAAGKIENIYLEYPVSGIVEEFKDHNSITIARTEAFLIGGSDPGTQLCHLELFVNSIAPSSTLSYSIIFLPSERTAEPKLKKLEQKWPDRYKLRYTWSFRGNEYSENQWRLVSNNSIVEPPEYRLWAVKTSKSLNTPNTVEKTKLK